MRAVAYLVAEDDVSAERVREKIYRWCERRGVDVVAVREDEPCRVWRFMTLGGLMTIMEDKDHVVVADLEHLKHPKIDWSVVEELAAQGRRVLVVGQRRIRPPRPKVAPKPKPPPTSQEISERLVEGRKRAVARGSYGSGPTPYGYKRDYTHTPFPLLVHDETEAKLVREIFRQYLRMKSMAKLVKWLDQGGHRTRRGAKFSRAGVSWILKNRVYIGRVRIGEVESKGQHEPLISMIVFNNAQALMSANNKRGPRGRSNDQDPG